MTHFDDKKLSMHTPDLTQANIEKIAQLFPQVITEAEDDTGNIVKKVDFDLLKQHLSKELVEDTTERYRLDRPGKKRALLKANTPITKTLRPVKEDSVNRETTENLYLEGDNFEILKILQESYLGKIKMIYIDPPYNTGKDFVYKDNFNVSKDEYEEEIGAKDEEGGKLFKNSDTNGRYHSDWLSMMYSRLTVARDLLKDDGVIFMSIDDNEVHNLRKIADEIFGEENFIANIIRNTNSSKNQSLFVSVSHEYCLIYTKNIETLKIKHYEIKWKVAKNNIDEYLKKVKQLQSEGMSLTEISEELKTLTKYPRFMDFTNYWYFDEKWLYMKDNMGGVTNGNQNTIFNPLTQKIDPIPPGGFRFSDDKLKELINENRIHFHEDGSLPRLKRYLSENEEQRPKSIMSDDQRPDYSILQAFNTPFDNPKQLSFMNRIIGIMDPDSIILDFFSWSATTAHAVMQLNGEDWWNRKWIMAQLPEQTDPESEAYKAWYNYITEIWKERIRRAGKKILEDYKDKLAERETPLDIWFRVYKTDATNMKDVFYHPSTLQQTQLELFASNIKEERTPEDLLTQVMLDLGLTLDLPLETKTIKGNTVFFVAGNSLVACFDQKIDFAIVDEIAECQPLKVVFRDASFADDKDRINVETRMKRLSPETVVSVL